MRWARITALAAGYRYVRAVVSAISSCSVSLYLSRNPG